MQSRNLIYRSDRRGQRSVAIVATNASLRHREGHSADVEDMCDNIA